MEQQPIFYTTTTFVPPYTVWLDDTHITEVKKGGQQVGIYTITPTLKKRGILLPVETWYALYKYRNHVNLSVDLATGIISPSQVSYLLNQQSTQQEQYLGSINSDNGAQETKQASPVSTETTESYPKQKQLDNTDGSEWKSSQPYPYQLFQNTQAGQAFPLMEFPSGLPLETYASPSFFSTPASTPLEEIQ